MIGGYNRDVKIEFEIPVPEDSLDDEATARVRRDALIAAVLRLFDERRISSAEAARDLGLTRVQFIALSRQYGVPAHNYTSEDLKTDLTDLERIEAEVMPVDPTR